MRHAGKRRLIRSENDRPAGPAPMTLIRTATTYHEGPSTGSDHQIWEPTIHRRGTRVRRDFSFQTPLCVLGVSAVNFPKPFMSFVLVSMKVFTCRANSSTVHNSQTWRSTRVKTRRT